MDSNEFNRRKAEFWLYFDFLKSMAYKKFNGEEEAEEAFNYALEKLSEDDWKRLQAFRGIKKI